MQNKIYPTCHLLSITKFLVLLLASSHAAIAASQTKLSEFNNIDQLLAFEIEGVSLNTSLESIPEILQGYGYTQAGNTMYTKQHPIPGGRKSIYRIEINDSETSRHITYFRGNSGGRVKSSPKQEKAILAEEADMARKLYEIVCADHTTPEHNERYCSPISVSNIQLSQGEFLQIGKKFGIKLSATETSTTIEVKYSDKN